VVLLPSASVPVGVRCIVSHAVEPVDREPSSCAVLSPQVVGVVGKVWVCLHGQHVAGCVCPRSTTAPADVSITRDGPAGECQPSAAGAWICHGGQRSCSAAGGLRRAERCATAPGVLILSEGWSSPMKRLSPLLRVVSAVHAAGDDRALRVGLEPDRQAGQRAAVHSSSDSRARGASSTILLRLR
jgi:hypothetical protein